MWLHPSTAQYYYTLLTEEVKHRANRLLPTWQLKLCMKSALWTNSTRTIFFKLIILWRHPPTHSHPLYAMCLAANRGRQTDEGHKRCSSGGNLTEKSEDALLCFGFCRISFVCVPVEENSDMILVQGMFLHVNVLLVLL